MSAEAARAFIQKLKSDSGMRDDFARAIRDGATDGAMRFAADNGHAFSGSDLVDAYAAELKDKGHSEADIEDMKSAGKMPDFVYGVDHPAYVEEPVGQNKISYADEDAAGESPAAKGTMRPY